VNNGFKYIHRRDAENAEVAQRISNQGTTDTLRMDGVSLKQNESGDVLTPSPLPYAAN
jgi:hypothetical protein